MPKVISTAYDRGRASEALISVYSAAKRSARISAHVGLAEGADTADVTQKLAAWKERCILMLDAAIEEAEREVAALKSSTNGSGGDK